MKTKKQIVNREQAIEIIMENIAVSDWDTETMVLYIEEQLVNTFYKLTDDELNKELISEWENRHQPHADEECPFILDESPTARVLHGD
jgi:hypothetical protein